MKSYEKAWRDRSSCNIYLRLEYIPFLTPFPYVGRNAYTAYSTHSKTHDS